MRVKVVLFGSVREAAATGEFFEDLRDGARLADLRILLAQRYPSFGRLGDRLAAAVNQEIARPDAELCDGDEVAFLPPVAGGATTCTLSQQPLDPAEVAARVAGPDAGGVVSFQGAVRNQSRGREILHLEYEAYPPMAVREMQKIADEAGNRWPGARVAIAHRSGRLEIGELAVVVVAAAAHRAEAFEACRFAIDRLKQSVPIWKKEVARDGASWVEEHA